MKKLIYKNSLIKRIFFGIIFASLIIPIFFITKDGGKPGRVIGSIGYMIIAMIGYYELLRVLNFDAKISLLTILVIPFFVLLNFDIYKNFIRWNDTDIAISIENGLSYFEPWVISLIFAFVPFIMDMLLNKNKPTLTKVMIVILMSFLIPLFTKAAWIINMEGIPTLMFFIGIAIVSDTMSYFGGYLFGKKWFKGAKFAPTISPKKTWAGFAVGFTFTSLYTVLIGYYCGIWDIFGGNSLPVAILFGMNISFIAPYGDLLFSLVKRKQNVKDFSNLIPGHGGIFDRLDALTIVISLASLVYLFA